MNHCVRTYSTYCLRGELAIFTMRHNGERRLTIAVSCAHAPYGVDIVQARGRRNRWPTDEEEAILQTWGWECLPWPRHKQPEGEEN